MRVITGEYRGRKLEAPYGDDVRPTSDKVKESIFNMLMFQVEDTVCVDLFAGTGNLGIEALSRGARYCYFADSSRESIKYIKANIEKCKAEDKSKVVFGDYMRLLERLKEKCDIFFLDPPYESGYYEKALKTIESLDLLRETGIIVAEHGKETDLPENVGRLVKFKEKKYGKIKVSLYHYPQLEEE